MPHPFEHYLGGPMEPGVDRVRETARNDETTPPKTKTSLQQLEEPTPTMIRDQ